MKIINKDTEKIYYDSKGKEIFIVVEDFWEALKKGKIQYRTGAEKDDIFYTEILVLSLKSRDFEKVFREVANSEIGKAVMIGKLPLNTLL